MNISWQKLRIFGTKMRPDLHNTASWEALHKRTGRLDDRGLNHSKFTTPLYQRIQLRTDNLGQNLEEKHWNQSQWPTKCKNNMYSPLFWSLKSTKLRFGANILHIPSEKHFWTVSAILASSCLDTINWVTGHGPSKFSTFLNFWPWLDDNSDRYFVNYRMKYKWRVIQLETVQNKDFSNLCDVVTAVSSQIHTHLLQIVSTLYQEIHPRKVTSKISGNQQNQWISTPQQPLDNPQTSRQPPSAVNQPQLPASTTSQQHQISISFQPPTPGSSTKSASASRFHHQTAAPKSAPTSSFHHQAAAPNQH